MGEDLFKWEPPEAVVGLPAGLAIDLPETGCEAYVATHCAPSTIKPDRELLEFLAAYLAE